MTKSKPARPRPHGDDRQPPTTPEEVAALFAAACTYFGCTLQDLLGRSKGPTEYDRRAVVIYLMRFQLGMSADRIHIECDISEETVVRVIDETIDRYTRLKLAALVAPIEAIRAALPVPPTHALEEHAAAGGLR